MPETSLKDTGEALQILAKASYTPSSNAREKIEQNCKGCQRSRESKISFCGPLPAKMSKNT
jgi:hypothetical protein